MYHPELPLSRCLSVPQSDTRWRVTTIADRRVENGGKLSTRRECGAVQQREDIYLHGVDRTSSPSPAAAARIRRYGSKNKGNFSTGMRRQREPAAQDLEQRSATALAICQLLLEARSFLLRARLHRNSVVERDEKHRQISPNNSPLHKEPISLSLQLDTTAIGRA